MGQETCCPQLGLTCRLLVDKLAPVTTTAPRILILLATIRARMVVATSSPALVLVHIVEATPLHSMLRTFIMIRSIWVHQCHKDTLTY